MKIEGNEKKRELLVGVEAACYVIIIADVEKTRLIKSDTGCDSLPS